MTKIELIEPVEELERMKNDKKEVREKEDLAMRRMKFLNIPSTVSFQNRKHSRSESVSDHRKNQRGTNQRQRFHRIDVNY